MSEAKDDGGQAFPTTVFKYGDEYLDPGMTLRDYFASKAMQGFCANTPLLESFIRSNGTSNYAQAMAEKAYALADTMLKARE